MKKVLFFSLMMFSMFVFGQDIKMKKGIVTVDGKEWAKYDGCGGFDTQCSFYFGESEIVLSFQSLNDPAKRSYANSDGRVTWFEVKFLGTNKSFEIEERQKKIAEILYKSGVIDEKGNILDEKVDRLVEKYGTQYSQQYFKNSNQNPTVIINNNTTSDRPRNGVNISIGR